MTIDAAACMTNPSVDNNGEDSVRVQKMDIWSVIFKCFSLRPSGPSLSSMYVKRNCIASQGLGSKTTMLINGATFLGRQLRKSEPKHVST